MGRIAIVKFNNILDALSLWTKTVKVNLPLVSIKFFLNKIKFFFKNKKSTGQVGEPLIHPSNSLKRYLETFDVSNMATEIDFSNAGILKFHFIKFKSNVTKNYKRTCICKRQYGDLKIESRVSKYSDEKSSSK